MESERSGARLDAKAFLMRHHTGVLASVSGTGQPHAALINYVTDEEFNVYFLTLISSRKFAAIQAHPQVAFTVSTSGIPQTLQLEGMAMDISLDAEAREKKDSLFAALNANPWFSPPLSKLDPEESAIIWIRPTWVRWADYAFQQEGSAHVFQEILVQ